MNQLAAWLRELINISVSSVLLMMAVANFNAAQHQPKHQHTWQLSLDGLLPALSYMVLVSATGLFAWVFWRRRSAGNNRLPAILNALSFTLLVGAAIYDEVAN